MPNDALLDTLQTNSAPRALHRPLTGPVVFLFRLACRRYRLARTMRILRTLSKDQIKDAGIDRSLIHAGPEVEIEPHLMSTLMSLR